MLLRMHKKKHARLAAQNGPEMTLAKARREQNGEESPVALLEEKMETFITQTPKRAIALT